MKKEGNLQGNFNKSEALALPQLTLKVSTFTTPLPRADLQELSQVTPELNRVCPNLKLDGDLGLNSLM